MAILKVYVSCDKQDSTYYSLLKAWLQDDGVDFCNEKVSNESSFEAAHEERMSKASCCILIVSENTKDPNPDLNSELEFFLKTDIPILAVNINGLRHCDNDLCPPILLHKFVLHVSFNHSVIQLALKAWPIYYEAHKESKTVPVFIKEDVYKRLGL